MLHWLVLESIFKSGRNIEHMGCKKTAHFSQLSVYGSANETKMLWGELTIAIE